MGWLIFMTGVVAGSIATIVILMICIAAAKGDRQPELTCDRCAFEHTDHCDFCQQKKRSGVSDRN